MYMVTSKYLTHVFLFTDYVGKRFNIKWMGLTPYIIVNSKVFDCKHGVDRNVNIKEKRKKEKNHVSFFSIHLLCI